MRNTAVLATVGVVLIVITIVFDYTLSANLSGSSPEMASNVSRSWIALSGLSQAARVVGAVFVAAAVVLKTQKAHSAT